MSEKEKENVKKIGSATPLLVQTSLIPVVTKADPALRRSSRLAPSSLPGASASTSSETEQVSGAHSKTKVSHHPSTPTIVEEEESEVEHSNDDTLGTLFNDPTDPADTDADLVDPDDPADPTVDPDDPDVDLPGQFLPDVLINVLPPPPPPPVVAPPPIFVVPVAPPPPPVPPLPLPVVFQHLHPHQHPDYLEDMAAHVGSGIPPPPAFAGDTALQCPQEWIRRLRYWVGYREMTAAQTRAAIPVLLQESALVFYQGLADAEKDTLDHFEEHFLQHYRTEGTLPWLDLAALWACKQQATQTVEQYLNEISKLALRTAAPAAQVLQAALSGLTPQLRAHIVLHQIVDMSDLRNKAMLAEKSLPPASSANEYTETLKTINKQLAEMKIHAVEEPQTERSGRAPQRSNYSNDRPRSQSGGQRSYNPSGNSSGPPSRSNSASNLSSRPRTAWQPREPSTVSFQRPPYQPRTQNQRY